MGRDSQLNIEIKNGELQISIGIDLLCFAVQTEIQDFKITDNDGFVQDILNELSNEEEDGTTAVHKMLDQAANSAIENGSENAEENEEE